MKNVMERQLMSEQVELAVYEMDLLQDGGIQVLSALIGNPTTIRQLALRLGLNRTRVKFIVERLKQRGLVRVYQETQEGGRLESYFTATVEDVTLVLNDGSSHQSRIQGAQLIFQSIQTNALRAITDPTPEQMTVLKLIQCRMSPGKVRDFVAKLEELANEFNDAEEEIAEETFALALMLYPILVHQSG